MQKEWDKGFRVVMIYLREWVEALIRVYPLIQVDEIFFNKKYG